LLQFYVVLLLLRDLRYSFLISEALYNSALSSAILSYVVSFTCLQYAPGQRMSCCCLTLSISSGPVWGPLLWAPVRPNMLIMHCIHLPLLTAGADDTIWLCGACATEAFYEEKAVDYGRTRSSHTACDADDDACLRTVNVVNHGKRKRPWHIYLYSSIIYLSLRIFMSYILEAFHMSCQRRILRICWFHRVTNAEVTSQTEQEDLTRHIRRRRAAVFGHVRRLAKEAPGQMAMWLEVDTRAGGRPDNNPHRKQRPGRPSHTWVRQVEFDISTFADVAWDIGVDRCSWRVLRPQLVKRDWWWWWWWWWYTV